MRPPAFRDRKIDKFPTYKQSYRKRVEAEIIKSGKHSNACAICRDEKPLVFDHCHQTGLYRGHICQSCNMLLGLAQDNRRLLLRAAGYIANFERGPANNLIKKTL